MADFSNGEVAVVTKPTLKVILNGGSDVLESARIPIQFGVNDALAEIQPTHVLVIIQHEREVSSSVRCIRKLVRLSQGSDFICFESAGNHRVTFVALKATQWTRSIEEEFSCYLQETGPGCYRDSITIDEKDPHKVMFSDSDDNDCVQAVFSKNISLPLELFAKKPSNWRWKWANLWHRYPSADQCEYRKRLIYAFSLKPVVWFLVAIVAKYLWALLSTIWLVGAKTTVFLAGWRTEPILRDLDKIWSWHWAPGSIDWDVEPIDSYGVWDAKKGEYYPVTGSGFVLAGLFWGAVWYFCDTLIDVRWFNKGIDWVGACVLGVVAVLLGLVLIRSWTQLHFAQDLGEKIGQRRVRPQEKVSKSHLYFEWLMGELNERDLPEKIDIDHMPMPFKGVLIHKFRLSFNAKKAAMCKPFPRH